MNDVKQLAKLLRSFDLSRLEYENDGTRIVLERNTYSLITAPQVSPLDTAEPEAAAQTTGTQVTSPLVGVVYRAREPGAPPLAEIGRRVKKGDPIAIIEAMKMFSEIPAPCDGVVTDILFEDGALAEFGTPLLTIG